MRGTGTSVRAVALAAMWALAGCTSPPVEIPGAALGPTTPAPTRGQDYASVRALLEISPEGDARVTLLEQRRMRVDRDPWQTIEADDPAITRSRVTLVAERRCKVKTGRVSRAVIERASWYVFDAGRLIAFDHVSFDSTCATRRYFGPSAPDDLRTERTLKRYVAQRHMESRLSTEGQLRLGIALVGVGRLEEAEQWLGLGKRRIGRIDSQLRGQVQPNRQALLEAERAELRALRDTLELRLAQAHRERDEAAARAAERALRAGPGPSGPGPNAETQSSP